MANSDSSKRKPGKSPDPYLRTFLRQAVAIISAERGLNDVSQAKLQALASQLGLSESAYHNALDKLKRRNPDLGLNRYEQKFVEFLSSEFEKISGDVLNIRSENRVIDLAARKFQISEIRAHQLIQKTAAEFDVGTISHHDAELFAANLIDDAIEDRLWLREEDKKRLLGACQKWGMSNNDVELAVQARLARNRRQRNRSVVSTILLLAMIVVLGSASIYVVQLIDWSSLSRANNGRPAHASDADSDSPASKSPAWFDPDLEDRFRKSIASDNRLAKFESLEQWQAENREQTYTQLMEIALGYAKPNKSLNAFIANLYLLEPNAGHASVILESLREAQSLFAQGQLISIEQLRQAFAANHLLDSILETDLKHKEHEDRARAITQLAGQFNPDMTPRSSGDLLRFNTLRLVENSWRNALAHASVEPRRIVSLLAELERQTRSHDGPAINEIRTNLVVELLGQLGSRWEQIRDSLSLSIGQGDSSTTDFWIKQLEKIADENLAGFVAEQLALRLDLDETQPHESLMAELRNMATANRYRAYSSEIAALSIVEDTIRNAWKGLGEFGVPALDRIRELPDDQIPELALKCMASNNVSLNWIRCTETGFTTFNKLHLKAMDLSATPQRRESAIRPQPTPFENRRLRESLARIADSKEEQSSARISALQTIVNLATKFEDIRYGDAVALTDYLVAPWGQREKLEIERALPNFSKWANLKLAIIDHFSSALDRDKNSLQRLLGRLGTRVADPDDGIAIQAALLDSIASEINESNRDNIVHNQWVDSEPKLIALLNQRSTILAQEFKKPGNNPLNELLDAIIIFSSGLSEMDFPVSRYVTLLKNLDAPIVERVVYGNQLLAELFQDSNDHLNYELKVELNSEQTNNHARRLLYSELLLMESLKGFREQWLDRIGQ